MIRKSAREIMKNAATLANADNSSFTDFYTTTNLLNNCYREVYDVIVTHTEDFTEELTITGNTPLPENCYTIIKVETPFGIPITDYKIRNGIFYYNGPAKITYSTLPVTLTAPDKAEQITDETVLENLPTDHSPYYVIGDDANSITFVQNTSGKYLNKDFVIDLANQTFTWDGEDVKDLIDPDELGVMNIQYDSPYMVVTYNDYSIKVFTGWSSAEWNYDCIYGHDTYGEIIALKTNDETGKGMVWKKNDGTYFFVSFVPDTILEWPTNTLFTLMEYKLAGLIGSLIGTENPYLTQELTPKAEVEFYKLLNFGQQGIRRVNYDYVRVVR